jgi:hypothetical protein
MPIGWYSGLIVIEKVYRDLDVFIAANSLKIIGENIAFEVIGICTAM